MKKFNIITLLLIVCCIFYSCNDEELSLEKEMPKIDLEEKINLSKDVLDFSFLPLGKTLVDSIYIRNKLGVDINLFKYKCPEGIEIVNNIENLTINKGDSVKLIVKATPNLGKKEYTGDTLLIENDLDFPLVVKIKSTSTFVDSLSKIKIDSLNLSSCYIGEEKTDSICFTNGYGFDVELTNFVGSSGFTSNIDTLKIKANSKAKLEVSFNPTIKKIYLGQINFQLGFGAKLKAILRGIGTEDLFMYVNKTILDQTVNIGSVKNEIVYEVIGDDIQKGKLKATQYNGNEITNMNDLAISVPKGDTLKIYRSEDISSISNLKFGENDIIHEDLFFACKNLKSLNYVFAESSIKNIPNNLFSNLEKLESIEYGFKGCENITNLPDKIFEDNTELKSLKGCFSEMKLNKITEDIIASNWSDSMASNQLLFIDLFKDTEILEIASKANNLSELNNIIKNNQYFKNLCSANNISRIHLSSQKLYFEGNNLEVCSFFNYVNTTSQNQTINVGTYENGVPYVIRNNTVQRGSFKEANIDNYGIISNVDNLALSIKPGDTLVVDMAKKISCISNLKYAQNQVIPQNLFSECENVLSFSSVFKRSENAEIPSKLFENNKKVLSFENAFESCQYILEIPQELFKNNSEVKTFRQAFKNSGIIKIYDNVFPIAWGASDVLDPSLFDGFLEGTNVEEIEVTSNNIEDVSPVLSSNPYFKSLCSNQELVVIGGKKYSLDENGWVNKIPFEYTNTTNTNVIVRMGALKEGVKFKIDTEEYTLGVANIESNSVSNKHDLIINVEVGQKLLVSDASQIVFISGLKYTNEIPEGVLDDCINLKSVESIFEDCIELEVVPQKLFKNNKQIRNFSKAFKNTKVKSLPDNIFSSDLTQSEIDEIIFTEMFMPLQLYYINSTSSDVDRVNNVITHSEFFRNLALHKSILTLGENYYRWNGSNWQLKTGFEFINREGTDYGIALSLFVGDTESYYINGVEAGIVKSVEFEEGESPDESKLPYLILPIPNGGTLYIEDATKIRAMSYLRTTKIPKDFFKNCVNLECLSGLFYTSTISEIPKDFFKGLSTIKNFAGCFMECQNLEEIPTELFKDCTNVIGFEGLFKNSVNIKTVPADLFNYSDVIDDLNGIFMGCSGLETIPQNLFENCAEVTDLSYVFQDCTSLVEVPENLFKNCSKAIYFNNIFNRCSKLKTITGVFNGCSSAVSFYSSFNGCSALDVVPSQLFKDCDKVTFFGSTFFNCGELKIYSDIFPTTFSVYPEHATNSEGQEINFDSFLSEQTKVIYISNESDLSNLQPIFQNFNPVRSNLSGNNSWVELYDPDNLTQVVSSWRYEGYWVEFNPFLP